MLRQWIPEHSKSLGGIDVRRFISFGVIKGFLYRVHRYPIYIDPTYGDKKLSEKKRPLLRYISLWRNWSHIQASGWEETYGLLMYDVGFVRERCRGPTCRNWECTMDLEIVTRSLQGKYDIRCSCIYYAYLSLFDFVRMSNNALLNQPSFFDFLSSFTCSSVSDFPVLDLAKSHLAGTFFRDLDARGLVRRSSRELSLTSFVNELVFLMKMSH